MPERVAPAPPFSCQAFLEASKAGDHTWCRVMTLSFFSRAPEAGLDSNSVALLLHLRVGRLQFFSLGGWVGELKDKDFGQTDRMKDSVAIR